MVQAIDHGVLHIPLYVGIVHGCGGKSTKSQTLDIYISETKIAAKAGHDINQCN